MTFWQAPLYLLVQDVSGVQPDHLVMQIESYRGPPGERRVVLGYPGHLIALRVDDTILVSLAG